MAEKFEQSKNYEFEVKKWNPVARWAWDLEIQHCAICRNHIMDLCIECQSCQDHTYKECTVTFGLCNHGYHGHCIGRWLQNRKVCPLDNTLWAYYHRD